MKMKTKITTVAIWSLMSLNFLGVATAHAALNRPSIVVVETPNLNKEDVSSLSDQIGDKEDEIRVEKRGNTNSVWGQAFNDQMTSYFSSDQANGVHFFPKSKIVKGAPYSAEVISETIQKLSDGNVISKKMTLQSFRDSQGRTREERHDSKGEIQHIRISDQDDNLITLNVKTKMATKTATQFSFTTKTKVKGTEEATTEVAPKSNEHKDFIELHIAGQGTNKGERHVIVKRFENGDDKDQKTGGSQMKTVTVDVRGAGAENFAPNKVMSGAFMQHFADAKWANKRQTKSLGMREFDGIKAEGKSTSFEIPAGEIGNAQAIIVTDETWVSPELQITVYSKHSDPRSGDRIYSLKNLKRDEVPASMFVIPADYTVRDTAKEMKKWMQFDYNHKPKKGEGEKK